jgi:hypothetical protein
MSIYNTKATTETENFDALYAEHNRNPQISTHTAEHSSAQGTLNSEQNVRGQETRVKVKDLEHVSRKVGPCRQSDGFTLVDRSTTSSDGGHLYFGVSMTFWGNISPP